MKKYNRYIIFSLVLFMVISLVSCTKEEEVIFMDISIDQVLDRFEDETLQFTFEEEELENGLTKFIGKNIEGMGSTTLTLVGDKEKNKLSTIKMAGKVSRENEQENTYNALYLLGLINSCVEFNDGQEWLLEGMKKLGQDQKFVHEKEIDGIKLKMFASEINRTINLEVLKGE